MQEKSRKNRGITLIALVITIIILLILAGISISSLTESGLFQKAQEATRLSEIKEIEEFAKISYMNRQIEEVTGGENATIAGVISDLKEKGYKIKEIIGGSNSITGIAVSEENLTVQRNTEKTITYTFVYSDGTTVRYFVEIDGKDYEIIFNNGEIKVNTEETNLGEISKEPEVTVTSSDSNIIEVNKTEEGKIVLTAKDELGDVTIIVKETNSNVAKTFTATTRISATSIEISKKEATIEVDKNIKLTATIEPSNITDKIIWISSDENIATVEQDGNIKGISEGEVTITVTCGDKTDACKVTVIVPPPIVNTSHTAKDISSLYTWAEIAEASKIISNNDDIINKETTEEVTTIVNGKTVTIGVGDITLAEGKKVRILGFNHDELVNRNEYNNEDGKTNTYAGISFEYVDFITDKLAMNVANSNTNGWGGCNLRTTLNETVYNSLISIKNHIKEVKKEYIKIYNKAESKTISNDKLWLLSCGEIWAGGEAVIVEGKQYKYYKKINPNYSEENNKLKKPSNLVDTISRGDEWWLRSPNKGYSHAFTVVYNTGAGSFYAAQSVASIAPGFAI